MLLPNILDVVSADIVQSKLVFPEKFHRVLDVLERQGLSGIVSWVADGRGFKIHHREAFVKVVLSRFFTTSNYKSFVRSLNLWGFRTEKKNGPWKGVYFHRLFLRQNPSLCHHMQRVRIKGNRAFSAVSSSLETLGRPSAYVSSSSSSGGSASDSSSSLGGQQSSGASSLASRSTKAMSNKSATTAGSTFRKGGIALPGQQQQLFSSNGHVVPASPEERFVALQRIGAQVLMNKIMEQERQRASTSNSTMAGAKAASSLVGGNLIHTANAAAAAPMSPSFLSPAVVTPEASSKGLLQHQPSLWKKNAPRLPMTSPLQQQQSPSAVLRDPQGFLAKRLASHALQKVISDLVAKAHSGSTTPPHRIHHPSFIPTTTTQQQNA